MARPKDPSVSLAFQEKCDMERDKLQHRLAKQLRSDMERLLDEGCHSDVTLLTHGDCLNVHKPLLEHRAPGFYQQYIENNPQGMVTIEEGNVENVKRFIRSVYTEDELPESPWVGNDMNANGIRSKTSSHDVCPANLTQEGIREGRETEGHDKDTCTSGNGSSSVSTPHTGCCGLGTDLLGLYHAGTKTDVVIEAKGKYFKAHRFILCSRSSYFAAMLGGGWRESDAQVIKLESVSAGVMEQALLYMYGGVAELSAICDVGELVMLADMYGIAGIKEIATFVIRRDFCHFFHKPCSGCLSGICESLPIAFTFGLNDIQERCLRWSNKNFVRLWSTKPFALLPKEILDKCCNHLISDINSMTVLDVIMDTDRLRGVLPQVRWADPVVDVTTKVMEACVSYLSSHLVQTVRREQFMELGTTMAFVLEFVEGVFLQAISSMPVECACKTFLECKRLKEATEREDCDWTEDFKSLLRMMYKSCDHYMHQHVHLLVATPDWNLLSEVLQTEIKEGGWYVPTNDGNGTKPVSKTTSEAAVRPNKLPTRRRVGTRPGSSSKTPTPSTPGSAGSSLSSGGRTPQTPGSRKETGTTSALKRAGENGTKSKTKKTPVTTKAFASKSSASPGTPPSKLPTPGTSSAAGSILKSPMSKEASNPGSSKTPTKSAPKRKHMGLPSPTSGSHSSKLPVYAETSPKASTVKAESSVGEPERLKDEAESNVKPSAQPNTSVKTVSPETEQDMGAAPTGTATAGAEGTSSTSDSEKAKEGSKTTSKNSQLSLTKGKRSNRSLPITERKTGAAQTKMASGSKSNIKASSAAKQSKLTKPTASSLKTGTNKAERHIAQKDEKKKPQAPGGRTMHTRPKSSGEVQSRKSSSSSSPKSQASPRSLESKSPRSLAISSHPVSSQRIPVGVSRSPVTGQSSGKSPRPENRTRVEINRNNDAVYAKCTSMRLAAMKMVQKVDWDSEFETESVVSMMSHIAVRGSRTPSIVDLEFWTEDQTPNDTTDASTDQGVSCIQVNFAPSKTFTDVIIPILQTSVGYPATVSFKER